MGKNPAFQFYPSDWTRDLDDHPLEIEGAWIRICCRLWWSETRGKATKSLKEWSRILRNSEKKSQKIINFLLTKHICDGQALDNQNITIISRRMVKDFAISQIRREVGKLGGNPGLKKVKDNLDNQTIKQKRQSSSSSSSSSSKKEKNIYAESVKMTEEEYSKLKAENGEYVTNKAIQLLSNYKLSSGKNYKSDYHAILTWALEKAKGAGNGSGQPAGRFGVRPTPQEDPSVISDVEAINARFRAKQMARNITEKTSGSNSEEKT
jgi:hypothetical protein